MLKNSPARAMTSSKFATPLRFVFDRLLILISSTLSILSAVVRSPSKYANTFSSAATSGPGKVNVVAGDVTDPASLHTALAGCDGGVIFAASGTSYFSAKSVDYQVNTSLDINPIFLVQPIYI